MLDRLMGMESEYPLAIDDGRDRREGNHRLYTALRESLQHQVKMRAAGGLQGWARDRFFLQNGGSIYYEVQPSAHEDGLLEAGTPECRGPSELLCYMRAQDQMLTAALPGASCRLPGKLRLRRNGRDAQGNVYGPQENLDSEFADGWRLWVWRAFVIAIWPWTMLSALLHWIGFVLGGVVALVCVLPVYQLMFWIRPEAGDRAIAKLLKRLGRVEREMMGFLIGPTVRMTARMVRWLGWHDFRRGGLSFLATRMIFTGVGSETEEGFHLSEKASEIVVEMRSGIEQSERGILEIGHLLKDVMGAFGWRPFALLRLTRQRQRLQLGMSDATLCDVGMWLGFATTNLVLDMAEAGALDQMPPLKDPVAAAKATSEHGLKAVLTLSDGREVTPIEVQRAYLARAEAWVRSQATIPMVAYDVLKLWRSTLDALERDPSELVGQVDWVTKQALIEGAGEGLSWEARKKIDLRYHDLSDGYHVKLREAGVIVSLVEPDAVRQAMKQPPVDSPATERGKLIDAIPEDVPMVVDWEQARVGGPTGRVIYFDSYPGEEPQLPPNEESP